MFMPPALNGFRKYFLFFILIVCSGSAWAHTINLAMEKAPFGEVVWFYLKLGVAHIIPQGFDHILFITALCLLSNQLKNILWQATAFTVAHCVTLALSAKGVINLPAGIVEP